MRGIGIDAVDIERFRQSLERTPNMKSRLFTDKELASLADRADMVPSLAARFAAREATMKALGVGIGAIGFHDVWVEAAGDRHPPRLHVDGRARELADAMGIVGWHLSMTHTNTVAMAVVAAH